MSKPAQGFPDLAELARLDALLDAKGAHYVTAQPAVTHDAASRDNAAQPAVTHGARVRLTIYASPALAAQVRALMAAEDRSESYIGSALLAEALAARHTNS